jgi:hypothetical protein
MDELEWLRRNSPPTNPSPDATQRHRTQLRAAIAAEGADSNRPRRPRRRTRSRHRVLVTAVVVVVLCGVGAGIIALASSGGDDEGRIGAPVTTASAPTTTTPPTCTGTLTPALNIPAELGTAVAGPSPMSSDPVEPGQQASYWKSGTTTFEVRWPADAAVRKEYAPTPQTPDGRIVSGHDPGATVDDKGIARWSWSAAYSNQPAGCQVVEITVYGSDVDAVNALAQAFNSAPFKSSQPLVTTTKAVDTAPEVVPCAGPVDAKGEPVRLAEVDVVATVGGTLLAKSFARPEDALADFLRGRPTLAQRGYQALELADGSVDYAAEPRPGAVVTVVHVTPTKDGWAASEWNASGC